MTDADRSFVATMRLRGEKTYATGPRVMMSAEERDRLCDLAEQAPAWRDMSTAPKDGTWLLTTRESGAFKVPVVAHWSDRANGSFNWNDGEYTYSPSHWQPLPLPPSTGERS